MEPDHPGLLTPERRHFVQRLSEEGVRVLVVGGEAVRAAGVNRLTKDLDIVVERQSEAIQRILDIAAEFGFGGPRTIAALAEPGKFGALYVRLAPRSMDTQEITHHVDILFADVYLPEFEKAFAQGVPTPDCPAARYANIDDLIAMKERAVGNPRRSHRSVQKDRGDLEFLLELRQQILREVSESAKEGLGMEETA